MNIIRPSATYHRRRPIAAGEPSQSPGWGGFFRSLKKWLHILFLCSPIINAAAQEPKTHFLISDELVPEAVFVGIRIDGVEVPDCGSAANHCTTPEGNHIKLTYDITALVAAGNDITVEARSCNSIGICGAWSTPIMFDLSGPPPPGGLRITVSVTVTVTQ